MYYICLYLTDVEYAFYIDSYMNKCKNGYCISFQIISDIESSLHTYKLELFFTIASIPTSQTLEILSHHHHHVLYLVSTTTTWCHCHDHHVPHLISTTPPLVATNELGMSFFVHYVLVFLFPSITFMIILSHHYSSHHKALLDCSYHHELIRVFTSTGHTNSNWSKPTQIVWLEYIFCVLGSNPTQPIQTHWILSWVISFNI